MPANMWGNSQSHFFNTRILRVSELLADFCRGKVLDIGCGPALVGNLFLGKPIEYYGVDVSEAMIAFCRESFGENPQFAFSVQEIETLAFPDASFDVVLCLGVLEYVLDEPGAMDEVVRVLRPGGVLIATMLNRIGPYELYDRFIYGRISGGLEKLARLFNKLAQKPNDAKVTMPKRPLTRKIGEKAFQRLLTLEGFTVEDTLYYDFQIIPPPFDARIPRISVTISKNLEFLCRSEFRFLGRGLMVKCRRTTAAAMPLSQA